MKDGLRWIRGLRRQEQDMSLLALEWEPFAAERPILVIVETWSFISAVNGDKTTTINLFFAPSQN